MNYEEEQMSTQELLETREKEVYLALGKVGFDDPKRQKLMNEAKTFSEIRIANEQSENNRLNNNARNDIEEQKLVIENERIKVDKRRTAVDIAKIVVYTVAGIAINITSYMMDPWFQKDSRMQRFGERIHDMLTKR